MLNRKKRYRLTVKKQNASIPRRLNLLFFIIVLLFTVLILRLEQMQIGQQSFYMKKLTALTSYTVKESKARGQIFDAKGVVLVENDERPTVAFSRGNNISSQSIKELANKLSHYITLTEVASSDRAKRDYYLADKANYKKVVESLPDSKRYDKFGNHLAESTVYANAVAAVPVSAINYSEDELKVVALFNQMNATPTFGSVKLSTGELSDDQIKKLDADKKELLGISVTSNWHRRKKGTSLSDILGTISTEKAGLPREEVKKYLKKGYSLNDRVGTSYLEKQYEDDLQGIRQIRKVVVNKKGKVVSDNITQEGKSGRNLKLTFDLNYQNKVESILKQYYGSELSSGRASFSEGMYAVAIEPSTGKVLAMAGLKNDHGNLVDDSLGTIAKNFTPGSVVKGATLSSGWENKVLRGNEVLYDQEIANIRSWFTRGLTPISAAQALEYSSNTYMVQVALRLMGQDYNTGDALTDRGYQEAMAKLRKTYGEYGLGVSTGLDLPESEGYVPGKYSLGTTLMESFGQYDAYTPMQLGQYISTIANNGNRLAPHVVSDIYEGNDSNKFAQLVRSITPKTLNKIAISDQELAIIQEGFYNVVNSGSGYATGTSMRGNVTTISGKTGTAETFAKNVNGQTVSTYNLNAIAYDTNRKIAVAVMYPHVTTDTTKSHQLVARDMIDQYISQFTGQ
ncbi:penicillin-binding protein PBP2B [Streptococcus agalactiae]